MEIDRTHPIVLFDGVCNLCNGAVRFIVSRDPNQNLRFSHLQSETGRALLAGVTIPTAHLDSLVLLENDAAYIHSTAILKLVRHLRFPWPLLSILLIIPSPLRDAAYKFIAKRRYHWFGRSDVCQLPSADLLARMLD
ncbi:MAG: DCC1-like thiol-disulfide oxidoreductase family protein [Anaerolineae bacterium]|nr:DCC1-like thiol-disulfide oxidoreductase family protein [Anaerolineae bacterium]